MMFPNKNKAAVNKLIARSLKANRSRNRYVILAIALTTWLLTSVFSIGMSYVESFRVQELRMLGTTAHAQLTSPSAEQLLLLRESAEVIEVGLELSVADWIAPSGDPDLRAGLSWYDDTQWQALKKPLLGKPANGYPQERNEAIVPTWVLGQLGIDKPQVGQNVSLTYAVRTGEASAANHQQRTEIFRLSGWYEDYPHLAGRPGTIIVSRAFADEIGVGGSGGAFNSSASVASIVFKGGDDIDGKLERLTAELALTGNQALVPVSGANGDPGDAGYTYAGTAVLIAFVMFSGYLLIYNVLYVSISADTKQYGLLKTIGATQRQIRRLVRGQANRLAALGIPIGLFAGAATSFIAVPEALGTFALETGVAISFHPAIFAGAALFAWLTTMAGSRKPAQIAGKISPIEAAKYVRASGKRGKGGAKLHRMAIRNLFRDKKRAAVVFLSLFLGMTTFLTVNSLVLSMDTDNFIDSYVEDDFELENATLDFGYEGDPKPKITADMMRTISELKGVNDVRATYVEWAYMPYSAEAFAPYVDGLALRNGFERPSDEELSANREGFSGFAVGLDSRYVAELNKSLETPIDIGRFERGEIALLSTPDVKPGTTFKLGVPGGGGEREFVVGGTVPANYRMTMSSFAPNVYISVQAMEMWLEREPVAYRVAIQADERRHPQIREQLEGLITGDYELRLSSKLEWQERMKSAKIIFYVLGSAFTLILAGIGILNFASTMFTSVIVRRQELTIMESVGMTSGQLRKLLLLEGSGYALISLVLVSTFGTSISYGAYKLFSQEADYAIYTFPLVPFAIAVILILATCWSVPLIAYNSSRKMSIVERLREAA